MSRSQRQNHPSVASQTGGSHPSQGEASVASQTGGSHPLQNKASVDGEATKSHGNSPVPCRSLNERQKQNEKI